MADREQPMDLAYTPTRYPRHNYTGQGDIVTVRVGPDVVGHLTRQDDKVCWAPQPNLSDPGNTVRTMVWQILADGARTGRPLDDAWQECLDSTQHDGPVTGALDELISAA
jgi:hypothetical protein